MLNASWQRVTVEARMVCSSSPLCRHTLAPLARRCAAKALGALWLSRHPLRCGAPRGRRGMPAADPRHRIGARRLPGDAERRRRGGRERARRARVAVQKRAHGVTPLYAGGGTGEDHRQLRPEGLAPRDRDRTGRRRCEPEGGRSGEQRHARGAGQRRGCGRPGMLPRCPCCAVSTW